MATILGLLLVVTFIANYISTTLPNTMGQNDLQHDVEVQNQVAQLSALMQVTAESGTISAQVSQAVTLGSVGAPPFAAADSSTIAPGNQSSGLGVNFTIAGPLSYNPPTGGTPGGTHIAQCTYPTLSQITCSGTFSLFYNFTGSDVGSSPYSVSLSGTGYTAHLNLTVNSSAVTITTSGTLSLLVLAILGNLDTISVPLSNTPENILIVGSNDTLILTGSGTGNTNILVVGNDDKIVNTASGNGHTFVASFYGSRDQFQPGTISGNNNIFGVYFTGYNPSAPSSVCPMDNLAGTDTVTQPTLSGSGDTFTLTYNNTTGSTGTGANGHWTPIHNNIPASFACPYYSQFVLPIPAGGAPPSASIVVHLNNVYSTRAEVALDQGAVVYAQPGGLPVFVVPPRISLSNGVLSLFVPRFTGHVGSESGVGTADVSLRLLSTQDIVVPSNQFSFQSSTQITITIISPYVAAWYAYFHSSSSPFAPYVTCTGSNSVCTALYSPGGPLGTLKLAIPTTGLTLNLLVGLFSENLA
ncbi:MAG TPA: hypothetical protein VJ021_08440 [Thermoplasmata archaeon]|nr:hypothetical protein [Thermoplasmata archaeon]